MRRLLAIFFALSASAWSFAGDEILVTASMRSPQAVPYDVFGADVCMTAVSRCVVGVRGADTGGFNAGAVDVFDLGEGTWRFAARLTPPAVLSGDQFGEVIASHGEWLVVSSTRHDAAGVDSGAVWVFRLDGLDWRESQLLLPPAGSAGWRFGSSLAIRDGVLAIGAPLAPQGGAVAAYTLVGQTWSLRDLISNPTPEAGDRFGDSVAVAGGALLAADPFDDAGAVDRGTVFCFADSGRGWDLVQQIAPTAADDRQYFGRSISSDGTRLAVGAFGADGNAGAITASGRVEVFASPGGVWSLADVVNPPLASAGAHFGWDVDIEGELLTIGEPGASPGSSATTLQGQAWIFRATTVGWQPMVKLKHAAPASQDLMGAAVAQRGGRIVVAAPGRNAQRGAMVVCDAARDCNSNGTPDLVEIASGAADCDGNLLLDACQPDTNGDGVANACQCRADVNADGAVGPADLAVVLTLWGSFGANPADMNGDQQVNAQDVTALLSAWGLCG